jgi:arabinan endo-1,5-alpha-L-arabinosidase
VKRPVLGQARRLTVLALLFNGGLAGGLLPHLPAQAVPAAETGNSGAVADGAGLPRGPAAADGAASPLGSASAPGVPASRAALQALIIPVSAGAGTHDPTIIRDGDWYYRFGTGPGVSVARSADLRSWSLLPPALTGQAGWIAAAVPGARDCWAPEVIRRAGRFWMYYSVSSFGSNESAIGLASAETLDPDSPDHGWTDHGRVLQSTSMDDFNAIDANVVEDGAGGLWLAFGSFWDGIKLLRLDPATGKPDPADRTMHSLARRSAAPDAIEGAFILLRGGWFYLFVSFDFCCKGRASDYKIAVGRSRDIRGPYLDREGRSLREGGGTVLRDGDAAAAGMGHNSILSEGGRSLIVYHAYDLKYGGQARLRIEELVWDGAGWPLMPSQLLRVQP